VAPLAACASTATPVSLDSRLTHWRFTSVAIISVTTAPRQPSNGPHTPAHCAGSQRPPFAQEQKHAQNPHRPGPHTRPRAHISRHRSARNPRGRTLAEKTGAHITYCCARSAHAQAQQAGSPRAPHRAPSRLLRSQRPPTCWDLSIAVSRAERGSDGESTVRFGHASHGGLPTQHPLPPPAYA